MKREQKKIRREGRRGGRPDASQVQHVIFVFVVAAVGDALLDLTERRRDKQIRNGEEARTESAKQKENKKGENNSSAQGRNTKNKKSYSFVPYRFDPFSELVQHNQIILHHFLD
jgi:hypothetical protein